LRRADPALGCANSEALKWIALFSMTSDHATKILFGAESGLAYEIGRMAMPIFMFVFGANLARPGSLEAAPGRLWPRLFVVGLACQPIYALSFGSPWFMMNVMFTLLAAAVILHLVVQAKSDSGTSGSSQRPSLYRVFAMALAAALFVLTGGFLDGYWAALVCVMSSYLWFRSGSIESLVGWFTGCAGLAFISESLVPIGMAALLPWMSSRPGLLATVPRMKWFFYVFYPAHLVILMATARALGLWRN
jgi:hypothetical protein